MYSTRPQASGNHRDDAYEYKGPTGFNDDGTPVQDIVAKARREGNDESGADNLVSYISNQGLFEATIDQLIKAGKSEEWTLLQYLAWFDPEFIPEELLLTIVKNESALWKAIANLMEFSFISIARRGGARGFAIHREVQEQTVRYATNYPKVSCTMPQVLMQISIVLNEFLPEITDDPNKDRALIETYASTITSLFEHSANRDVSLPTDKKFAMLSVKLGRIYEELFVDINKSLIYKKRALTIYQSIHDGNHLDVASSLSAVGNAYAALGDVERSIDYQEQALTMNQSLYEGNHLVVATSLNAVGIAYERSGNLEKGLDYEKRALEMMEALHPGENHPTIVIYLSSVGLVYKKLGDTKKELEYKGRSIAMRQALGEKTAEVADSISYIGTVYQRLEDFEKSRDYLELALKLRQDLYKDDHPRVAASLYSLGVAYQNLGEIEKSLAYYKQALKMKQALYKGNHFAVANCLNAVGFAYENLGDVKTGLVYYEQALKMIQTLHKASDHNDVVQALNRVGFACEKLGNIRKGLDYQERAVRMKQSLEGNSPGIASLLDKIGLSYQEVGDIREGLDYCKRALIMRQYLYSGRAHSDIALSLDNVGLACDRLEDLLSSSGIDPYKRNLEICRALGGHWSANSNFALKYYTHALSIRRSLYPGNHPDVATSLNNIGMAHEKSGDVRKGLAYKEQALEMRQALYEGNHPKTALSLNAVAIAYSKLGDVSRELDYRGRAILMTQALEGDGLGIADSLNVVGIAYYKLGNVIEALYYYEQALKMRQNLCEYDSRAVIQSLKAVSYVYNKLGDLGKHNLYKLQASTDRINDFVKKRGLITRDIISVKQKLQEKVLNKLQHLSSKGDWHKKYMGTNRGVSRYIEEGYLKKQLGKLSSDKNIKIALALCFEAITIGIANSEEQNLNCATGFAMAYPELTRDCALEHPEYFVLERIAASCLEPADYNLLIAQAAPKAESKEAFKGEGTSGYDGKSYYEYYNTAIDKLLAARLGVLDSRIRRLDSWYLDRDWASVGGLAYKVSGEFSNSKLELVLAPANLYNEHWLGLAFRKSDDLVEVIYMDSEQKAILPGLMLKLQNSLLSNGYESRFLKISLEKQSYNNCGPELIENFVYYLTGTRATQEGAVYVHSLLVENSLLDPMEYGLKLEENNKFVGLLSHTASIDIRSIDAPTLSSSDLIRGSPKAQGDPRVKDEDEDGSAGEAVINSMLHRAIVWFKALDLVVDSARLVQEPTMAQGKKLALDYAYLQGMVSGMNGYSVMIGGAEAMYQLQLGEYRTAFSIAAGTLSAMALPAILAMANRPYLGIAYGAWIATSTAYDAITNAYSFALALGSSDATLKSAMAYKDLAEWLAASPAQSLNDFGVKAKEYKLQINDLLFEKEKFTVQAQIKSEFEQKVFDYIYLPELIEKYALLNDVIRGELTEEEAQSLKSKPIAISYGALEYDACVKTEDSREEEAEHYYCCNIARQIFDHVVLTVSGGLEVLERL